MADIEDRIKKHTHAFKGLLSLVPANDNKRKLTKEKRKEAKKAKLDPEANRKGKPLKAEEKIEDKKEKAQSAAVTADKELSSPKQDEQRKTKQKPKQKKADDKEPDEASRGGDSTRNVKAKGETAIEKKPVPKPPSQKETKVKAPAKPKEPSKPSKTLLRPPFETPDIPTTDPAPSGTSGTSTDSPTTIATTPPPASKPGVTPTERAAARARLAARIVALRSKRKADGPDGTFAKNRHALLEARHKKETSRKERKKALRLAAKLADEPAKPPPSAEETIRPLPTAEEPNNDFMFGAVTFDDGQELDHTLSDFKKTWKRKGPTDVMGQLKHAEAKKARLENMDPEKAEKIHEKEMWSKALKQTAGEKVRDDEKLLKKALKRQEVQKRKSEREWKERKDSVSKGIAMRQKKREGNINARKEQKKLGKSGKKAKASGKRGVQKKGKSRSRPGFEGGMKTGKPAGKSAGKSGGGSGKRSGK